MKGGDPIPAPMEILVLELNIGGKKSHILGYEDCNEVLHHLSPYNMGGNNNELNKACVARWAYFSDVIERYGIDLFEEQNTAVQIYEF